MLRARCRPQSEKMVVRISEGATAADGHESKVALLGQDQLDASSRLCRTSLRVNTSVSTAPLVKPEHLPGIHQRRSFEGTARQEPGRRARRTMAPNRPVAAKRRGGLQLAMPSSSSDQTGTTLTVTASMVTGSLLARLANDTFTSSAPTPI